jgi:hypothetical protein
MYVTPDSPPCEGHSKNKFIMYMFGFFILNSIKNSSHLIVLLSHFFSNVVPATNQAFVISWDDHFSSLLIEVCIVFIGRCHNCFHFAVVFKLVDFASSLENDDDHLVPDQGCVWDVSIFTTRSAARITQLVWLSSSVRSRRFLVTSPEHSCLVVTCKWFTVELKTASKNIFAPPKPSIYNIGCRPHSFKLLCL